MFAVSQPLHFPASPARQPLARASTAGTPLPWRALRCTLLAAICCWLSQSIIRQAHVSLLVSRASALSSGGNAVDRPKAEDALRQARRLAPGRLDVKTLPAISGAEFDLASGLDHSASRSVTEDISRRLLLARGEPTGEDRALWGR